MRGREAEQRRFLEEEFVTPTTVERARAFGYVSGRKFPRLTFEQFFSKVPEGVEIPYPRSIYGAYKRGHETGTVIRLKRLEREEHRDGD